MPPHHRAILAPPGLRRALLFSHRSVARHQPVRRDRHGWPWHLPSIPERRCRLSARGGHLAVLRRTDGRGGGCLALAWLCRWFPPARTPAPGIGHRLRVRQIGPPFRGLLRLYRTLRTRPGARAILLRAQPADHGRLACAIVGGVLARRRRGALRGRAVAVVAP